MISLNMSPRQLWSAKIEFYIHFNGATHMGKNHEKDSNPEPLWVIGKSPKCQGFNSVIPYTSQAMFIYIYTVIVEISSMY